MYRLYEDLRDKLGEPQWHDEHGVPRYCAFHPSHCGIYDQWVALLEIDCQGCSRTFLVSASYTRSDIILEAMRRGVPIPSEPPIPTARDSGDFGFGDAPWHEWPDGGQCSGTTMTTGVLRVVEFWTRDGGEHRYDWRRRPEYEFVYESGETEQAPQVDPVERTQR